MILQLEFSSKSCAASAWRCCLHRSVARSCMNFTWAKNWNKRNKCDSALRKSDARRMLGGCSEDVRRMFGDRVISNSFRIHLWIFRRPAARRWGDVLERKPLAMSDLLDLLDPRHVPWQAPRHALRFHGWIQCISLTQLTILTVLLGETWKNKIKTTGILQTWNFIN